MSSKTKMQNRNMIETAGINEINKNKKPINRQKQYNQYMSLKYTPVIEERNSKKGNYYVATIPQFPGLLGTGATIDEAIADMEEAKGLYILDMMSENELIPLPDPGDIKVSVFFTGQTIEPSQFPQQFENIVIKSDLDKDQDFVQSQTKSLTSGISIEYTSPTSGFHAADDIRSEPYYITSAPSVKTDQSNRVRTY